MVDTAYLVVHVGYLDFLLAFY